MKYLIKFGILVTFLIILLLISLITFGICVIPLIVSINYRIANGILYLASMICAGFFSYFVVKMLFKINEE